MKIAVFEEVTQSVVNSLTRRVGRQRAMGESADLGDLAGRILTEDPKLTARLNRAGADLIRALEKMGQEAPLE